MELDLDAFLASQSTSSDDDRLRSIPHHRTVDEILNDSDSSSPPSLNQSFLYRPRSSSDQEDVNDASSSVISPKTLPDSRVKFSSSSTRVESGEFSANSLSLGRGLALRPLPLLFGSGVRSTVKKPGAALAAAVAASRPTPTPHAAALKSRRAGSSSSSATLLISSVLGSQELDSKAQVVSKDGLDSFAPEISHPDVKLVQENDVPWDNYQSAAAEAADSKLDVTPEISGKGDTIGETSSELRVGRVFALEPSVVIDSQEVSPGPHIDDPYILSRVNPEEQLHLEDSTTMSVTNGFKYDQVPSSSWDENNGAISEFAEATETANKRIDSSHDGRDIEDELPIVMVETSEIDKAKPLSRHGASLTGDDTSYRNDVMDLDEDIISQWESKRGNKRTQKKSRASLKPLELAEEIEKKHAFIGLDMENDIAAQPMRLEGVRRGSTALGYFDVYANNTITRTISSQAFRRDQGSPQVVAVHLNYIAVGMSKGVVIVVPSKYSPHCADNMDAKVACKSFCSTFIFFFFFLL